MMGLFELSTRLRKVFGVVGLIIVTLVVLWLIWLGARAVYNFIGTQEQTNPETFFGAISTPILPKSNVDLTNTSFQIDLPESSLPSTPEELAVYPIPRPTGTLTSLEDANNTVRGVGFKDKPKRNSEAVYTWVDSKNTAKSIKMNIASGEFTYKYDLKKDQKIIQGRFTIDKAGAIRKAQQFLGRLGSFPKDLSDGPKVVNFYKQIGSKRTKVTSFSEANEVEIYFFRKSINDQYAIVQSNPDLSLIRVLLGTNLFLERGVVEAEYVYWPFELDNSSIYPIKTSEEAWSDFQQGKASFVKGIRGSYEEIFLEKVELAYYETKSYQPFAQPIYIFSGAGISKNKLVEFVAYLPAVRDEHLK